MTDSRIIVFPRGWVPTIEEAEVSLREGIHEEELNLRDEDQEDQAFKCYASHSGRVHNKILLVRYDLFYRTPPKNRLSISNK